MKAFLIRFSVGMLVAGLSGAIDGALITLAAPEAVFEHWKGFMAVTVALGLKAAFLYFKQHEKELNDFIDPRRIGTLLLIATCLSASACVSAAPPPRLAPTVITEEALQSEAQTAANWAATAVDLAHQIQRVEIASYRNGGVTDDAHRTIQTAFGEFGAVAEDALTLALDAGKSEATRWASSKAVGASAAQLLARVGPHLPLITKGYVDSLKAVLTFLNGDVSNAGGAQ